MLVEESEGLNPKLDNPSQQVVEVGAAGVWPVS